MYFSLNFVTPHHSTTAKAELQSYSEQNAPDLNQAGYLAILSSFHDTKEDHEDRLLSGSGELRLGSPLRY